MTVQILGTGCAKCQKLYNAAAQAVAASGVTAEIEKIEDLQQIVAMGVMLTPALAIDGQVKSSGKLLTPAEIGDLLRG
ncbi:MAG: TM0996/MTH895 family glutaredoxin-like protein [Fimbriimonadaceae bacterium]|nr:TM0996/MTH895 family glutaredoxin-like protein [Fimbriimonadaceae bacterium]